MVQVNLTKTELFKSFDIIESEDIHVDLHNAFDCYDIDYSKKAEQFCIKFRENEYNNSKINHVELIFDGVVLEVINFNIGNNLPHWVVSLMYRGKCDAENEGLSEMTTDGKYYYYLDFYEDYQFELRANSVIAILREDDSKIKKLRVKE